MGSEQIMAGKDKRLIAAWICCPKCDKYKDETAGKCPGRDKCKEITSYLEWLERWVAEHVNRRECADD